jgi:UDP-N-acetylmuramate dehydrogenase
MKEIQSITTKKLSYFRTLHHFQRYAEVKTQEEFQELCQWAKENKIKVFILGNGSNVLFSRQDIQSLVIKNNLSKTINPLPNHRLEVTSSVLLVDVLKYCYKNSLDAFYYLASVPATIGGALAMNAGGDRSGGLGGTIYDFVESVTFIEDGEIRTLANQDIAREHRKTMFTGIHDRLILSAILRFEPKQFDYDPIASRLDWSKEHQDHSAPNCGSVFKLSNHKILCSLRGFHIGKTRFSSKTANWILNNSDSSTPILFLIKIAQAAHFLVRRKTEVELIIVD